jgi:hypothetical protein
MSTGEKRRQSQRVSEVADRQRGFAGDDRPVLKRKKNLVLAPVLDALCSRTTEKIRSVRGIENRSVK